MLLQKEIFIKKRKFKKYAELYTIEETEKENRKASTAVTQTRQKEES